MRHRLVPRHEVLSKEEAEKLLKFYNVTKNEIPRIKKTDPALKDMDVKVGDIIKITRESPTSGVAIYYRVVIEG